MGTDKNCSMASQWSNERFLSLLSNTGNLILAELLLDGRHCPMHQGAFGWAKTVAGLRKMWHRGLPKVDWQFTRAMAAHDFVRLPKLLAQPAT
jgi:hypothetical protein